MIKIYCESKFQNSVWCKQIVCGITSFLKKKRRKYCEISTCEDITTDSCGGVFLVGTNDQWINDKVKVCNDNNIIPIVVCNQRGRICKGRYHCVSVDIEDAMKQICERLASYGCTGSVFYGLNPSSASDRGKAQCFIELQGKNIPIIENNGNTDKAFEELYEKIDSFDSVICSNDFVAVLLVKKLLEINKKLLDNIKIISCSKALLSTVYDEYILSQETDYDQLGSVSAEMFEFLTDKEFVSSVTISVKCRRFSDVGTAHNDVSENLLSYDNAFYDDKEMVFAMKVDDLLSECKDEDLQILRLICLGKTYSTIAQDCFMSESNVKYHVKKYCEILGLKGREELKEMLSGYIIY